MLVVVTIPAHNEERTIDEVIRRVPRNLDGNHVKVIVVDDGSTDMTAERAKNAGADAILRHQVRRGLGQSFASGLRAALDMSADIIVNIDADAQYDPEQIPQLIEPIAAGTADIVLGSRFAGWIEKMPLGKRIGNRIATLVTSHLAGISISDAQTGFRALSKQAAMRLNIVGSYTYVQETIIQAARKRLRVVEVPISFRQRMYGESRLVNSIFSYARRTAPTMLRTYRDYRPLATFVTIGAILVLAGLAVGSRVLVHFIQTGQVSPFIPSAILTAVLVLLGFQAIFLGLVADMLGSTRTLVEETVYLLRSRELELKKEKSG